MPAELTIGVLRERGAGERRVALVPEVIAKVPGTVVVESGAGDAAWFTDDDYRAAGAEIAAADVVNERADVLLRVAPPDAELAAQLPDGRAHAGLLRPLERPAEVAGWASRNLTTVCLDLLPRTLSRAQTMDALTSQASVAGYRAVVLAADTFGRLVPDADDGGRDRRPAEVLVLGAGVAGLQAIGTARRLGARVAGYDIRPAAATR